MAAQLFADAPRPEMTAQVDDATMHEALTTLGADPMTVLTDEEREAHDAFIATLGENALWLSAKG